MALGRERHLGCDALVVLWGPFKYAEMLDARPCTTGRKPAMTGAPFGGAAFNVKFQAGIGCG